MPGREKTDMRVEERDRERDEDYFHRFLSSFFSGSFLFLRDPEKEDGNGKTLSQTIGN